MYTTRPLEFHIICDEEAQNHLEKKFLLLEHPAQNILLRFYRVSRQSMTDRIQREGGIHTDHSAGVREYYTYILFHTNASAIEKV